MIHINLQPEYIMRIAGLTLTNTLVTSFLVTILLTFAAILFYLRKGKTKGSIVEGLRVLVFELLKLIDTVTGDRRLSKRILPLVATFFLFIVCANLLGLVPGFLGSLFVETPDGTFPLLRSPSSDLNTTVALAIFSVLSIQFFSLRALGVKRYLARFFNLSSPIRLILGFFEMISEGVKILSFSFRLFGNIFAGEVLLLIIAFLVPYLIPVPFMLLEVFVGIIQAFIFAMLTLTFIKTSTMRHLSKK